MTFEEDPSPVHLDRFRGNRLRLAATQTMSGNMNGRAIAAWTKRRCWPYTIEMMDWARVEGFEWDDGNGRKISGKHGVGQGEAEQVFFNEPLLVVEDPRHGMDEARFHALGRTDEGRPSHVTFTLRSAATRLRVISARDMSRKERTRYAQER